jgi:CheY-like chemotaxis protein
MAMAPEGSLSTGLRQLRHDLLNPLNVVMGACGALTSSDLSDAQRAWVRMIESAMRRVHGIIDNLESYRQPPELDGHARLVDLCSIAAARVAKPFDRARLIEAIERVTGSRHLRILLVDDSPELATLVRAYLKDTGWDLDVVETGERAVAQATTERYDVVLMDIDLPGLDGATAAHAIRAADLARGVSPTPIIAMTAFDPDSRSAPSPSRETAGGHDFVHIDDAEIAPLVPQFIEHRKAEVAMYRAALADGELGRIQSTAHKMKGTGRGFGLDVVSRIGGELELAAHEKDVPRMSALIDELDAYLQRVRITT